MTRPTKRVTIDGNEVEGTVVEYETLKEHWNEYRLTDGTLIKLRLVPIEFIVTGLTNHAGEPVVAARATVIVQSEAPRKEGGEP